MSGSLDTTTSSGLVPPNVGEARMARGASPSGQAAVSAPGRQNRPSPSTLHQANQSPSRTM